MSINATNFTVSILLLAAATIFVAVVRLRKPPENNWPFIYWIVVTVISFRYPDETFDPRIMLVGLAAGLFLRFEFIGNVLSNLVRFIEICVWGYILYMCFLIVTTA
jgi:hypothetical protein